MSLGTPPKLRRLQEALYTKAKQEPAYRFYLLYDKVYRTDILAHAYALSKQHGGAPGVDGVTFADIEAAGVEQWLAAVQEALRTETYRPHPVRRVLIPKPGGIGERPLGIPVIRDRVVQTAALLILQPIFEGDLDPPTAYGYRPGRTALEAVQAVHRALCAGHTEVIDADVSSYFDSIPHAALLKSLARRICDRRMLRLLKGWLKAPVAERGPGGGWRFRGGKRATRGTPQGGVVSPLLANWGKEPAGGSPRRSLSTSRRAASRRCTRRSVGTTPTWWTTSGPWASAGASLSTSRSLYPNPRPGLACGSLFEVL